MKPSHPKGYNRDAADFSSPMILILPFARIESVQVHLQDAT
jgi:hypothetical protein